MMIPLPIPDRCLWTKKILFDSVATSILAVAETNGHQERPLARIIQSLLVPICSRRNVQQSPTKSATVHEQATKQK